MQVQVDLKVVASTVEERWTHEVVDAFIEEAVGLTGLSTIAQRAIIDLPDVIVFFQLIAESHISGHLNRHHGLGWVDIFSCKPLDAREVGSIVQRHLTGPDDGLRVRVLGRGILPEGGPDGAHDQGARAQGQAD